MKEATETLIAFLASGKAFVMWDTFTFTLADGTELVYNTRDPDAPPLPASIPLDFNALLDTFAGVGTLETHVGEQAADWITANPGRGGDLALLTVSDGFILQVDGGTISEPFNTQWVPQGNESSLYIQANVAFTNYSQEFWMGLAGAAPGFDDENNKLAQMRMYIDNGANGVGARVFLVLAIVGDTSLDVQTIETAIVPDEEPHVYRLELRGGRSQVIALIDDVQVLTQTLEPGDTVGAILSTYILPLQQFSPGGPVTYEVQGGDILGFTYDSFTGTGNLSVHSGEIGAAWSVPPADPVPSTTAAILTGNGAVYCDNAYSNVNFLASGDAPVDNTPFFIEMDFTIPVDGYNGLWLGCGVCSEDRTRICEVQFFVFASVPIVYVQYFNGTTWIDGSADPAAVMNPYASNTMRMEVSNDRQTVDVLLNNTYLANIDLTGTPLAATMLRPHLYFGSAGETRTVSRFQGDIL